METRLKNLSKKINKVKPIRQLNSIQIDVDTVKDKNGNIDVVYQLSLPEFQFRSSFNYDLNSLILICVNK